MIEIYTWRGDTFDGDCMVLVLGEHEPYSDWYSVPKDYNVDTQLDEIAEHYGIDRDDEDDMRERDFPIKVAVPPLPDGFCAYCLHWFKPAPTNEESESP